MSFLKNVFNAVTDAAGFVGDAVSSAVKFILPSSASNTSTMSSNNFLTNTLQGLVGSGNSGLCRGSSNSSYLFFDSKT